MRKYLRLVIILAVFAAVVVFRQLKDVDDQNLLGFSNEDPLTQNLTATPAPTAVAVPSSTAVASVSATPTPSLIPTPTPGVLPSETADARDRPGIKIGSVPVFADGTFIGPPVRMNYGTMTLSVTMQDGHLEAINVVKYPRATPTSIRLSEELIPELIERAVSEQEWRVDSVSGATQTIRAFQKALVFALRAAAAP